MDKIGGEDQSSPVTMELPDKDISESQETLSHIKMRWAKGIPIGQK